MFLRNKSKKDILFGGTLFLLGIVLFVSSFSIQAGSEMGMGADFMPKLLSFILAVCGFFILVFAQPILEQTMDADEASAQKRVFKKQAIGFVIAFVLLFAYIFFLDKAGFIISSACYIFLQSMAITPPGKFRPVLLFIISSTVSVFVYYIFVHVLRLMLPVGILG